MSTRQILSRIAQVDPVHAATMEANPTTFSTERPPFYRRHAILSAQVRLRHKPLEFRYADDGKQLLVLGGTPQHIYQVNLKEGLRLEAESVPAYIRFFFANTGGRKMTLIERAEEVPWIREPTPDRASAKARESAIAQIEPVKVTRLSDGNFAVSATGLWESSFVRLNLRLTPDGNVEIQGQQILAPDLPVAAPGR